MTGWNLKDGYFVFKMRKSLSLLIIIAALATGAAIAEPQQRTKVHRIGYLASASELGPLEEAFRQGLRELGYVRERTSPLSTDLHRESSIGSSISLLSWSVSRLRSL